VYLSCDMWDLLELFDKHGVMYMLVGGHAVNYYGYVRTTQDIDILVYPSVKNAQAIMKALGEFGFAGAGIPREYFERVGSAVHLGVEPNRIDLLTHLGSGVSNDTLFKNKRRVELQGEQIDIISLEDLISVKRSSSRLRDQADAQELEKTGREK